MFASGQVRQGQVHINSHPFGHCDCSSPQSLNCGQSEGERLSGERYIYNVGSEGGGHTRPRKEEWTDL